LASKSGEFAAFVFGKTPLNELHWVFLVVSKGQKFVQENNKHC
jgi:hypothetical protein